MTIQDVEKGTREKSAVKSMMRLSRPKHPLQTAFVVTFFCCFIVLLISLDQARKNGKSIADHYLQNFSSGRYNGSANIASLSDDGMAKVLRAQDLMNRPLATDLTKAPKLFHQSWMDSELPEKFQEWCLTCRKVNSDWEWVLWTDADNKKMVEKFAPWFLTTYEDLPGEINRADAARNIYMHVFGGYARPTSPEMSTLLMKDTVSTPISTPNVSAHTIHYSKRKESQHSHTNT